MLSIKIEIRKIELFNFNTAIKTYAFSIAQFKIQSSIEKFSLILKFDCYQKYSKIKFVIFQLHKIEQLQKID